MDGAWVERDTSRWRQKEVKGKEKGEGSDGVKVRDRRGGIERIGGRDARMRREDGHGRLRGLV